MSEITAEKLNAIQKELGDVAWYLAEVATQFNLKLSQILRMNLVKLDDRKERGKIKGDGDNR